MYKLSLKHTIISSKLSAAALASLTALVQAQEATEEVIQKKTALDTFVLDGGPTMIFIGLAFVAMLFFIVLNVMSLTRKNFAPQELIDELTPLMASCHIRSVMIKAKESPSFLGQMIGQSFRKFDATHAENFALDDISDEIVNYSADNAGEPLAKLSYLSLIAMISPMLGLLGTILGMIAAFGKLGQTGQADPAQLAGDISVALLTTMWGLITALISTVVYFILKAKLSSLISESEEAAKELVAVSIDAIYGEGQIAKVPEGFGDQA